MMFHISYCVKFYKRIWPRKSEEYLCLYCFSFFFPVCLNIHEKNPLSVELCPKSHISLSKLECGRLQFYTPIVWCSSFSHWRTGMTTFVSTLSPWILLLVFLFLNINSRQAVETVNMTLLNTLNIEANAFTILNPAAVASNILACYLTDFKVSLGHLRAC